MSKSFLLMIALLAAALTGCQKNPKLGTVALDVYLHPESSSSEDVMLQSAIRNKLEADPMTAGHVHVRVVGLEAVLTGDVSKKEASDKAEQIARSTKVTVDNDPPIVAEKVKNLIKVGNQ
ncbi:MAG TPA: BON domain-containing protein [Bryobacteraceae bacterium]|nr:BON domain-containing protein [Bryobacteraceae bacterium]